ncbi:MAG: hypothetical protein R2825_28610 [Saprospiraceae bacterium]
MLSAVVEIIQPSCAGDSDKGYLLLAEVTGGTGNALFTNGATAKRNHPFMQLAAGTYELIMSPMPTGARLFQQPRWLPLRNLL